MGIIEIINLSFVRSGKPIFDNISLSIEKDKITAIMGPSGCGKTTLLKLISNQFDSYSGLITIKGKNIMDFTNHELLKLRRDLAFLFQSGALFSDLNVFENIAFPIKEHTDLSDSLIRDLVLMKLQSVGLRKVANLFPAQLSVGMAKRVALARTIALDPSIIMYDEPFAGQDPISVSLLLKLIKLLNKFSKMTTVIVSHDIYETLAIADYVYIINERKIIASGTPNEIRNKKDNFVQSFVNMKFTNDENTHFLIDGYEKDLFYI